VAATDHALAELLAADLSGRDLVALLIDGLRAAEHTCVVALGITIRDQGATRSSGRPDRERHVVGDLLVSPRDRGLDTARPLLVVLGGAKRCAVRSPT